jgi:hypothetical protein
MGTNSSINTAECGVPQGSILGPLLFLIYINDIQKVTNLSLLSFADDTTVYISGSNRHTLFKDVTEEIALLHDWFCANKLSLNIGKTNYSLFGPSQSTQNMADMQLILNGSEISAKMSRAIFCINRVKNVLPFEALKSLYYSLVHSHIIYGIQIWGNSTSANKIFTM